LRRKQGITALARLLGGTFEFGQPAPAEFFGKGLAGRDVSIEPGNRRFGLLVQVVEQRKIAAQRLLVAVELKGDAVDLRGNVIELLGEAAEPASAEENKRLTKFASLRLAGSRPRALPRISDSNLPVVPSSRFCVWARIRSANWTTECWARSPKVTRRERSPMLISDLMRATAATSGTMAEGRMLVHVIRPVCAVSATLLGREA